MPVIRDGVSAATLAANGVDSPSAAVLLSSYGFKWPGFVIPYHDLHGRPTIDGTRQYARLRLDVPFKFKDEKTGEEKEMKYYQHKGSSLHVYHPKGFTTNYVDTLVVVEGEMKALSLVEAGIPAVAIGGFYGFVTKKKLLPEFVTLLDALRPKRLLFLGDNDTSHNALFSSAAVQMASLVKPVKVLLPRIPIDMKKGIDDVRGALGTKFDPFWQKIVNEAAPVAPSTCPKRLSLLLFRREVPKIAKFSPSEKKALFPRIVKLGAYKAATLRNLYKGLIVQAGF